jgi:hypothetical protein
VTIPAEFVAPVTAPMFTMLSSALAPYEGGDLDVTEDLVGDLLDVIGAAEPTAGLIGSLKALIATLPPSEDVMARMYEAFGTAMDFTPRRLLKPAAAPGSAPAHPAPARTGSGPREDSIGAVCMEIMAAREGEPLRTQDFIDELAARGRKHGGGAVSAAMVRLTESGRAAMVATSSPQRWLRADDPTLVQQTPDATTEQAPDAPVTADTPTAPTAAEPGEASDTPADPTPAEPADTAKTPAARRGSGRTTGK